MTHGNRTGRVLFSNGLLIQWGIETITPVANTPTAKAVTFPVAYTSVPMVLTTALTTVPGTSVTGDAAANITVTGFDAYVMRNSTTNTSVGWIATGYKALVKGRLHGLPLFLFLNLIAVGFNSIHGLFVSKSLIF